MFVFLFINLLIFRVQPFLALMLVFKSNILNVILLLLFLWFVHKWDDDMLIFLLSLLEF